MIKEFFRFTRLNRIQLVHKPRIFMVIIMIVFSMVLLGQLSVTESGSISSTLQFIIIAAAILSVTTKTYTANLSLSLTYPLTIRRKISYTYLLVILVNLILIVGFALLIILLVTIFPQLNSTEQEAISAGNELLFYTLTISITSFYIFTSTIISDKKAWLILLGGMASYLLSTVIISFITTNTLNPIGLLHRLPIGHMGSIISSIVMVIIAFGWYELAVRLRKGKFLNEQFEGIRYICL